MQIGREGQDQSFILQATQQHFARLKVQMNDMRDQIEQNEEILRQLLPQTQRQKRHVLATLNHEDLENEFENEEGYAMEGEVCFECLSEGG